ncbi:hypothetical protein STEG23_015950, partial [Scotinomys teguina]
PMQLTSGGTADFGGSDAIAKVNPPSLLPAQPASLFWTALPVPPEDSIHRTDHPQHGSPPNTVTVMVKGQYELWWDRPYSNGYRSRSCDGIYNDWKDAQHPGKTLLLVTVFVTAIAKQNHGEKDRIYQTGEGKDLKEKLGMASQGEDKTGFTSDALGG